MARRHESAETGGRFFFFFNRIKNVYLCNCTRPPRRRSTVDHSRAIDRVVHVCASIRNSSSSDSAANPRRSRDSDETIKGASRERHEVESYRWRRTGFVDAIAASVRAQLYKRVCVPQGSGSILWTDFWGPGTKTISMNFSPLKKFGLRVHHKFGQKRDNFIHTFERCVKSNLKFWQPPKTKYTPI